MAQEARQLTEDQFRRADLSDQLEWRIKCRNSLVEFARSMPIPGVPQTDNFDEIQIVKAITDRVDAASTPDERKKAWKYYDGRFEDVVFTERIETELAKHHILWLETNQQIIEGKLIAPDGSICRRGMAFAPPGAAKSTYYSVVTPAWAMGVTEGPVILTSYADMLAKKHGKRARQLCHSKEYRAVFNCDLDPKTRAADQWALTNGSEYLAAGIQSGLTGNRAMGLIWDDLVKGRRAAESLAEQVATWDSYRDDARTRKIPIAWELGVMTRWHEKDVPGHILPEDWNGESGFFKGQDGYWWYILCIQAQAEHESDPLGRKVGEYLWSDWFHTEGSPDDYWSPLKLDSRSWGSLFQQVPTPPEGDFFKQSWVSYYDHKPKELNIYMSGDYAVTRAADADNPDLTSIGIWGMDTAGDVYFLDGWHGQVDSAEWTEIVLDFVEVWNPLVHVAGAGQIRRGTEPFMKRRMRDRHAYVRLEWLSETHGKEENARSFQAMMSSGMVHWPRGNEEAEFVIRHLIGFGTLRFDDPVDMCAMIGRWIAKMWEAKKPNQKEGKPVFVTGEMPITSIMPKDMRRSLKKRKI